MPFTPLHMGPGMLVKALLQSVFSLIIFGWTQVLMDIQPLVVLITGEGQLHGFSHTFVGSTGIAVIAALTGKPLLEWVVKSRWLGARQADIRLFELDRQLSWRVAALSAFIGSYSHVLLDAVMHADLQPFFPFDLDNPFLYFMSVDVLQLAVLVAGTIGLLLYFMIRRVRRG